MSFKSNFEAFTLKKNGDYYTLLTFDKNTDTKNENTKIKNKMKNEKTILKNEKKKKKK